MRVMICGANGQLGWELQQLTPSGANVLALDLPNFDLGSSDQVDEQVSNFRPDLIINAAAFTAVDLAEHQREAAFRANSDGAGNIARASVRCESILIHISTDFVFSGQSSTPYFPSDPVSPLSVYGESKAAGEHAVISANTNAKIVRTSWVYSCHGGNFVKTMLRLMSNGKSLSIVADQIGTPTWARGLANLIWALGQQELQATKNQSILHYADAGTASWYDFAVAIQEEALSLGILKSEVKISPIRSDQYPTPARRPSYSVLNRDSGWAVVGIAPHWRAQLREMLKQLAKYPIS